MHNNNIIVRKTLSKLQKHYIIKNQIRYTVFDLYFNYILIKM